MVKNNIAYIWMPHFNSSILRVDRSKQMGMDKNYVVVCCSPSFNGVYSWDASKKSEYQLWSNNGKICYCVPIDDCKYIKGLKEIKDKNIITKIKKTQSEWFKRSGREIKPDWML